MKKLLTILMAAVITTQAFAIEKDSYFQAGNMRYRVSFINTDKESEVYCAGFISSGTADLEIPSKVTYNGETFTVSGVDNSAFYGNTAIKTLTVAYGVGTISASAFQGCTNLTTITLPSSVNWIYGKAFADCRSLKQVTYALPDPTGRIINSDVFPSNSNMTLYVSKVMANAVQLYKDKKAFAPFTTITTSSDAYDIYDKGFRYVITRYATKSYPGDVTMVGWSPESSSYTKVEKHNNSVTFDGRNYNFVAISPYAFYNNNTITSADFSSCTSLVTVGRDAFSNCFGLQSINLNNSGVTEITDYMAFNCQNLTSFSANKATTLGSYALWHSNALTDLFMPNLQNIYSYALSYTGMPDIVLPYGVVEINSSAFNGASTKYLLVPSSCVQISSGTFKNMPNLIGLVLNTRYGIDRKFDMTETPKSCKISVPYNTVDDYKTAFSGFSNIVADGYDFSYGSKNNRHTNKYHMTITSTAPFTLSGVQYAGKAKYVHLDYMNMTDETQFYASLYETYNYFSEGKKYLITEIDDDCFLGGGRLTAIDLTRATSLERIGRRALAVCAFKNALTIPASVTSIGDQAFIGSSYTKEITILSPVLDYAGEDMLNNTASDLKVYVTPEVSYNFCKAVGTDQAKKVGVVFTADNKYKPLGVYMPLNFTNTGVTARIVTGFNIGNQTLTTKEVTKLSGTLGTLLCDLTPGKVYKIPNNGSSIVTETDYLRTSYSGPITLSQMGSSAYAWDPTTTTFVKPSASYVLPAGSSYLYGASTSVNAWKLDFLSGSGKKGDVNGDGQVDISDANILINILLGKDSASKYAGRADVTGDGNIDISDVNSCINIVLGKS